MEPHCSPLESVNLMHIFTVGSWVPPSLLKGPIIKLSSKTVARAIFIKVMGLLKCCQFAWKKGRILVMGCCSWARTKTYASWTDQVNSHQATLKKSRKRGSKTVSLIQFADFAHDHVVMICTQLSHIKFWFVVKHTVKKGFSNLMFVLDLHIISRASIASKVNTSLSRH